MTTSQYFVYMIAVGQIVFGLVALATGWAAPSEATTVLMIGLSTFGIHSHNVAVAGALRRAGSLR
jgi:hypothetical protein